MGLGKKLGKSEIGFIVLAEILEKERFFFGGTGFPSVSASTVTIGASQPPEQLNVALSGAIALTMAPSVLTSETSPVKEASAPPGKVDEELVAE